MRQSAAVQQPFFQDMLSVAQWYTGFEALVPDVIEFTMSDAYLNRPNIYPRQATLLKVIFLQSELFTEYDYEVIGQWTEAYERSMDDKGEGNNGIVPDVLDRIRICKAEGRKWFREVIMAIGRRGSKGFIGGIGIGYVLWHYLAKGDPQGHYGVDRDKRLACQVFAGKKEQARDNQWRDINNVILGSNCFTGGLGDGTPNFISKALGESLSVYAPYDFARMADRTLRGVEYEGDMATFELVPKESTVMSARGPASFAQVYDEMAHVVRGVAKSDAKEVWDSATPSLDQFGVDAFIYEPSSTWQRLGQFYTNYQKALEHDEDGSIAYPQVVMAQLTSWDPYEDWELTKDPAIGLMARRRYLRVVRDPETEETTGEEKPDIPFTPLKRAVQEFNKDLEREERANPETFAVERRSRFAAVLDAYLNPERISDMWKPWPTEEDVLTMTTRGLLSVTYRAHGDPSKSGANFGFAVAHVAGNDERGLPHVVFDYITHWEPGTFENHEIDYDQIGDEIAEIMDGFMPNELTFDQFNSVSTIQKLRKHARKAHYPKQVTIYERPATGPLNWKTYETFKTALGLGLLHAPYYDLANLELTFLQDLGHQKVDHPTSGPVQTKDVADCLAIVTYELIGEQMSAFLHQSLNEMPLEAAAQGGFNAYRHQEEAHQALSAFGRRRGMAASGAPRGWQPRR